MVNPIALAVPFLLLGVIAEAGIGRAVGRVGAAARAAGDPRPLYRLPDALGDLGCGVLSQATGLYLSAGVQAGAYTLAWAALHGPGPAPATPLAGWIAAFIAVDLCYYWWHRASHRVNLLWAAHVVHHQSEDYNLAVALRQAILTPVTSIPFYLPLVLLGVTPIVFLTCSALNTLGQFWIHTRLVKHLPGWFEAVFNAPSHHRVHHGINPAYVDKNHAGIFIVWDRWFGTFAPERAEPVYGVVEGHPTFDVVAANVAPLLKLFGNAWRAGGLDGLRLLFAPPEWRPASLGGPVHIPEPSATLRYDPPVPVAVQRYCVGWFVPMSGCVLAMLLAADRVDVRWLWLGATFIASTQVTQGALLDGRPSARRLEAVRLAIVLPALALAAVALAALGGGAA